MKAITQLILCPSSDILQLYFEEIILAESVSSGSRGGENFAKCFQDCQILSPDSSLI